MSNDPVSLFFDLNNIAFSHLKCNIGAGWRQPKTVFRTDKELREMKERWPSRTPEARKSEYAKAKEVGVNWLKK